MDEFEEAMRRQAAYHEAGHAVAALRSPRGRVLMIDITNKPLLGDQERGHTLSQTVDADEAFVIYAGSWAHASLIWPGETIDPDRVLGALRWNADDWLAFQQVAGHATAEKDDLALQASQTSGIAPPEYRPGSEWHQKATDVLGAAWSEIEELAQQMLDGQHEIELSNGQRILGDTTTPDRWVDPEPMTEFANADEDGLVGPLPPIPRRV